MVSKKDAKTHKQEIKTDENATSRTTTKCKHMQPMGTYSNNKTPKPKEKNSHEKQYCTHRWISYISVAKLFMFGLTELVGRSVVYIHEHTLYNQSK